VLKKGSKFGQYKILRRIGEGGFADVYAARDTVEGVKVALKMPHADMRDAETAAAFRREVRLVGRLDHPNILGIKHAGEVDGRFVVVHALGLGSLADRLGRRLAPERALRFAEQILEGVACAHAGRVVHLDLKPENIILFPGDRLRVADFGLARFARYTISGSGSGTVGYMAPEQAMGRPSMRSDVFAAGLLLYKMFSGELPEWPYKRPLPGYAKLKKNASERFAGFLLKALEIDPGKRFSDAGRMLKAFRALKSPALRAGRRRRRKDPEKELHAKRLALFKRRYAGALGARHACVKCSGPVGESMCACPWCGRMRKRHDGPTKTPLSCPRCKRSRRADWRFCAWCHGPGFKKVSGRRYTASSVDRNCSSCREKAVPPFGRYCPMCRAKTKRPWPVPKAEGKCPRCRWGFVDGLWSHCPWCAKRA
jgi:serine/threonine-protein kinase